jgi:hypothetical protein
MGPNRVNLYQPSTPSLLPRKLGERNGKIGKRDRQHGKVGIRRVIAALLGVRFSSLLGQTKRYGSGSKMHRQVRFSMLFYYEKKWGT